MIYPVLVPVFHYNMQTCYLIYFVTAFNKWAILPQKIPFSDLLDECKDDNLGFTYFILVYYNDAIIDISKLKSFYYENYYGEVTKW